MLISSKFKRTSFLLIALCGIASFTLVQCKKKKTDEEEAVFKKSEIMQNIADNYIGIGYSTHQQNILGLEAAWIDFNLDMSGDKFEAVQTSWKESALSFQSIRMFDFGPAMTNNLVASQGVFPADTARVDNNISSGSYDLNAMSNAAAVGFDALDFLLFQQNALTNLSASAARRQYVTDLIQLMKTQINAVVNSWASYKSTFISSTGTEITSSFSAFVNSFSKDLEIVKSAKVGIPLGTTTLGVNKPVYLEARRSGFGKELLLANTKGLERVYLGNSYDGNVSGIGFDDYLISLERTELNTAISGNFSSLTSLPEAWNGTMEFLLNNNESVLQAYYNLIYGAVPFIKADMASAFSVVITYQDNDGD